MPRPLKFREINFHKLEKKHEIHENFPVYGTSILGTIQVEVTHGSESKMLSLVIVKGEGPIVYWEEIG